MSNGTAPRCDLQCDDTLFTLVHQKKLINEINEMEKK